MALSHVFLNRVLLAGLAGISTNKHKYNYFITPNTPDQNGEVKVFKCPLKPSAWNKCIYHSDVTKMQFVQKCPACGYPDAEPTLMIAYMAEIPSNVTDGSIDYSENKYYRDAPDHNNVGEFLYMNGETVVPIEIVRNMDGVATDIVCLNDYVSRADRKVSIPYGQFMRDFRYCRGVVNG